jgi:hypothetical protein
MQNPGVLQPQQAGGWVPSGNPSKGELRSTGAQDAVIEFGKEQWQAFAEMNDFVALRVRDAGDQAMQSQPA